MANFIEFKMFESKEKIDINPEHVAYVSILGGGKKDDGRTDDPRRVTLHMAGGRALIPVQGTRAEVLEKLEEICDYDEDDDCCKTVVKEEEEEEVDESEERRPRPKKKSMNPTTDVEPAI